jgi:uroporphyrinogen-III synthase
MVVNPEIKILFTKDIPQEWIQEKLMPNLDFSIRPLLKIEIIPTEKFENRILSEVPKFLISSQNSVRAISKLNVEGEFYVVGNKTADQLKNLGFQVKHVENYAIDLAAYILDNEKPQVWNFFCGNNRRDELVEILGNENHKLNEIICYNSTPQELKIRPEVYSAFVFFSPLSVRTFFQTYQLPKNAVVFSIGNTTTGELIKHTPNEIITANTPDLDHLLQTINAFYAG